MLHIDRLEMERWPLMMWLVVCVALLSACSSSGDESSAVVVEEAAQDDVAGEQAGDPAEQDRVWADQLLASVREFEQSATDGPDADRANADAASAAMSSHLEALSVLTTSLPAAPNAALLAGRYERFVDATGQLAESGSRFVNANGAGLILYGAAREAWDEHEAEFEAACFDLQEAMTIDDLGVLGCVGLLDVDDAMHETFASQAHEGLDLWSTRIAPEAGLIVGDEPARRMFDFESVDYCIIPGRLFETTSLYDVAAGVEFGRLDNAESLWLVEVWSFADTTTRRAIEEEISQLVKTRKGCVSDFAIRWVSNGQDGDGNPPENLQGNGSGLQITGIPSIDRGEMYAQFLTAGEGNVLAVVSTAGTGTPPLVTTIDELVAQATVGGARP